MAQQTVSKAIHTPPLGGRVLVNDVHSALNPTWVDGVAAPTDLASLQSTVRDAAGAGRGLAVCGARHAMGGQQFASDRGLIDMRRLNRVLDFDRENGLITIEAGIQWPKLIDYLWTAQPGTKNAWGIRQKQTGADELTLGGAVSANVHGRGLQMRPLIDDIESMELIDAEGGKVNVSRAENSELFRLAVGGYGLFGVVYSVRLRLNHRTKVRRDVNLTTSAETIDRFGERIADGAVYGDFQFSTDEKSPGYLSEGIMSCYTPVPDDTRIPENQRALTDRDWKDLALLSHVDKARAFDLYTNHYQATDGQVYWSDRHQLSRYLEGYHADLDRKMGAHSAGSEVISELYVPRSSLGTFMKAVRTDFLQFKTNVIYGTVRLIESESESVLKWARESWACIVFNLHTDHTCVDLERAACAFRRLISRAMEFGGSFYLTYHRYATRTQMLKCYPELPQFLSAKRRYDPEGRFQSDWYQHLSATMPVG
jgi:FAD/FMN-containing dehydrogenase